MATSLVDLIFERFAKKIYIDVDPRFFTFYYNNSMLQLTTCVHVSEAGDRPKIVAVGETSNFPNTIKLNLFSEPEVKSSTISTIDLMAALFRYAIIKLIKKRHMIRPIIYFRHIHKLDALCHGNQENILRAAAIEAGAMLIFFE